jgi:hypothetical protein
MRNDRPHESRAPSNPAQAALGRRSRSGPFPPPDLHNMHYRAFKTAACMRVTPVLVASLPLPALPIQKSGQDFSVGCEAEALRSPQDAMRRASHAACAPLTSAPSQLQASRTARWGDQPWYSPAGSGLIVSVVSCVGSGRMISRSGSATSRSTHPLDAATPTTAHESRGGTSRRARSLRCSGSPAPVHQHRGAFRVSATTSGTKVAGSTAGEDVAGLCQRSAFLVVGVWEGSHGLVGVGL